MTFTLRPYQRESLDALYAYWDAGGGNPLIVLPTGAGKSLVIATLAQELLAQWPTLRIGVVTHVKELIKQNFLELMRAWPAAPAGIYSAGLGRRDMHSRILFCGIQSVHRKAKQLGGFDLLLVDEAHLIPRASNTTYGRFLSDLRDIVPDMRVVGLTATPYRLDSGRLDTGDEKLFDEIVYEANVADLIRDGYLSPLVSKATENEFDLTGVATLGGEYVPGALQKAVDQDWLVEAAVAEMVAAGRDRRAWLVFCAGVEHSEHVRDAFRRHGISCDSVTGETPSGERDSAIRRFAEGQTRCLTSVGVLTTGFNVPRVDLIGLMRGTKSTGLYVQQCGRGFRLADGKENCLILDFAGLVRTHGPLDAIDVLDRSKGKGEAGESLAKECPQCHTLIGLVVRNCPTCGHEYPPPAEKPKHEARAEVANILSGGRVEDQWVHVDGVFYDRHEKAGSPDSLRVTYRCGVLEHREWWCFEHTGFAGEKARHLWKQTARGKSEPPKTTYEAMRRSQELREPAAIRLKKAGKYFEITGRRFAAVAAEEQVAA